MTLSTSIRCNKQPVAWATHFAGLLAALVGTVALLQHASEHPSAHSAKYASMVTYCLGLIMVFGASSLYHFFDIGERGNRWLRRLDHCAIFALIMGSYAPFVVHLQDGWWRIVVMTVVAGLSLGGMIFKIVWIDCPDRLGAGIYLALAWMALIPGVGWLPQLNTEAILLLSGGGMAFTVGAIVYVRERPDPWPRVFGHHEIWHVFVLAGAGAHYFLMWNLVPYAVPAF